MFEKLRTRNQAKTETFWRALDVIRAATIWLIETQKENGSWGKGKEDDDDIFGTYITVWALSEVGLKDLDKIGKALNWFKKRQLSNGSWDHSVDSTTRGLITLLRCEESLPKSVHETFNFLSQHQSENEGWPREIGRDVKSEILHLRGVSDVGSTLPVSFR